MERQYRSNPPPPPPPHYTYQGHRHGPWWKKAVGTIKDFTYPPGEEEEYAEQIAWVVHKATAHSDDIIGEKYVEMALAATAGPPFLQTRLKREMEGRLGKCKHWKVAVKTLSLIHRVMREGDPTFTAEKMQHFSHVSLLHELSLRFNDRSSLASSSPVPSSTAWVRAYAMYLCNRLQCNRVMKVDVVAEDNEAVEAYVLGVGPTPMMEDFMPCLHQLMDCVFPLTTNVWELNSLLGYAMEMVVAECPKIYGAIHTCLFRLLDHFFSMPKPTALTTLTLFNRHLVQCRRLPEFYRLCRALVPNSSLPHCMPASDLSTMEGFLPVLQDHVRTLSAPGDPAQVKTQPQPKEEEQEGDQDAQPQPKEEQEGDEDAQPPPSPPKDVPLLIDWGEEAVDDETPQNGPPPPQFSQNDDGNAWQAMLDGVPSPSPNQLLIEDSSDALLIEAPPATTTPPHVASKPTSSNPFAVEPSPASPLALTSSNESTNISSLTNSLDSLFFSGNYPESTVQAPLSTQNHQTRPPQNHSENDVFSHLSADFTAQFTTAITAPATPPTPENQPLFLL